MFLQKSEFRWPDSIVEFFLALYQKGYLVLYLLKHSRVLDFACLSLMYISRSVPVSFFKASILYNMF